MHMQVVDAVYYDLVDPSKHLYVRGKAKVTVPTHMLLHHGFELQPLKATARCSKHTKALIKSGAVALSEGDIETIEENSPE